MTWFQNARSGRLFRESLYAMLAGEWEGRKMPGIGEWIIRHGRIPLSGRSNWFRRARLLAGGVPIAVANHHGAPVLEMPANISAPHAMVVAGTVDGVPESRPPPLGQDATGVIELFAAEARVRGGTVRYDPESDSLASWAGAEDRAEWTFHVSRPGRFRVELEYACEPASAGGAVQVTLVDQVVVGELTSTEGARTFARRDLGVLPIPSAGEWTLTIRGRKAETAPSLMNLRAVRLIPTP